MCVGNILPIARTLDPLQGGGPLVENTPLKQVFHPIGRAIDSNTLRLFSKNELPGVVTTPPPPVRHDIVDGLPDPAERELEKPKPAAEQAVPGAEPSSVVAGNEAAKEQAALLKEQRQRQRQRATLGSGRSSTRTSGLGLTTPASTAPKRVLGI